MRDYVLAGDRRVGKGRGVLSVVGLGSCVAVILYDESTRIGGLAHVLLPDPTFSSNPEKRWRFAMTAIPDLLEELESAGAMRERIEARLVGGACMFQELMTENGPHIGERNVTAARAALSEGGINLVGQEVGGDYGRSVDFNLETGQVRVSSQRTGDVDL